VLGAADFLRSFFRILYKTEPVQCFIQSNFQSEVHSNSS